MAGEGFARELVSDRSGAAPVEEVLEHHRDPAHLRGLLPHALDRDAELVIRGWNRVSGARP